ncbi:MAG: hypothetical protein QOA12_06930 [Nitrososphaeraceae archaeon]|nr:hypothetical protein [Nitrososphaeraceae archaeon]
MKPILLFVAASLMLIGARIAVVIPTLLKRTQTLLDAKILATLSALASTKKSSVKDPIWHFGRCEMQQNPQIVKITTIHN